MCHRVYICYGKVDIISLYRSQQDSKVNKNEVRENLLSTLFRSLEQSHSLTHSSMASRQASSFVVEFNVYHLRLLANLSSTRRP